MKHPIFQPVHPSWFPILEPLQDDIVSTFDLVSKGQYIPAIDRIFAPLSVAIDEVKVVIVGQDPYPNAEYADGFAFSVRPEISPFPASLINVFKELDVNNESISSYEKAIEICNTRLSMDGKKSNTCQNHIVFYMFQFVILPFFLPNPHICHLVMEMLTIHYPQRKHRLENKPQLN